MQQAISRSLETEFPGGCFEGCALPEPSALENVFAQAEPSRRQTLQKLRERNWFRRSSPEVQLDLVRLPKEWDGFLADLAGRPEQLSNVTVVSLDRLARGNYAITPVFNVVNEQGHSFTYEYVSWRNGPDSGVKGLVLLEQDGEPTHFVVLQGEKFATGRAETDSVGGFVDISVAGATSVLERIQAELREELGLQELKLAREPQDLGKLCVDAGMTNNRPGLFLASIDITFATRLGELENSDSRELKGRVQIVPIAELRQRVMTIEDSFFLACVCRAWADGALPLTNGREKSTN